MSDENNTNDTSRTDRAAQLLDAAMSKVAMQIHNGPVGASLLREIVQLAKAAGVEIAESGQPLPASADSVLASLADIDPALFESLDYSTEN